MKKLIFLLSLLTIFSCDKTDPDNPYNAQFNSRGCLECDNYTSGESFILDGVRYEVMDRASLNYAIEDGADLTRYCTSRVGDMSELFSGEVSSNQNIGNWDVSNVTDMTLMFRNAQSFNQDIGNWDVSNVVHMSGMFLDAKSFNQSLTQWCVSNFSSMPINFSTDSELAPSNHPVWGTCP